MMDPAVQTEFNAFKGSLPARLDANIADLDACAQMGQKVMAGGAANQLPNFALAFSPDTQGQIEDLLVNYWSQAVDDPGRRGQAALHHHRRRQSVNACRRGCRSSMDATRAGPDRRGARPHRARKSAGPIASAAWRPNSRWCRPSW